MPKIRCLCGEYINLSPIPNPQGFKLVWEPTIEDFVDELVSAHKHASSAQEFEKEAYKLIHRRKPEFPQVYECPNCGRLLVLARASDAKPAFWYQQEKVEGEADSLRSLVEGTGDS
jgi:hypothetical protein